VRANALKKDGFAVRRILWLLVHDRSYRFNSWIKFKGDGRMRMLSRSLPLILAAGLVGPLANAQGDVKPTSAPKAADSPSQVLLDSWNDVGRKLIAMAEDFPADKYDFKPKPEQRSFAEQLLHAAGANYFFINPVQGLKPPTDDPKRADYATKAAVVAYVKKSFADGAALIKSKGDGGMGDQFVNPFGNQLTRFSDGAWGIVEHSGEHYGQLVVYYRVAGLVPPESRPKK
jgi:uncharacterized damage-inducible protein DinB